ALALEPVHVLEAGPGERVAEGEHRSVLDDPADQPVVVVGRVLARLRRRARGARLRLEAEVTRRVLRDEDPHDVCAQAGPYELAEPVEDFGDLECAGQQTAGLDQALLPRRA